MLARPTEAAIHNNIQHYTALWMLANRKHSSTSVNTYLPSPPRYFLNYPLQFFDEVIEPTLLREADTYAQPNSINHSKNKKSYSASKKVGPSVSVQTCDVTQCHCSGCANRCRNLDEKRTDWSHDTECPLCNHTRYIDTIYIHCRKKQKKMELVKNLLSRRSWPAKIDEKSDDDDTPHHCSSWPCRIKSQLHAQR